MTSEPVESGSLADIFGSKDHWYALMDGAHPDHDMPRLICSNVTNPQWLAIYDFGTFQSIASHGPCLLKVDKPGEWLARWQADFPDVAGSFIRSPASFTVVADHLRTLISVRVEGGTESLFRFHDAWILGALYPALSVAERQTLHGPITDWRWPQGEQVVHSDSMAGSKLEGSFQDGWLLLDQHRQAAIHQGMIARRNWKETQHG